MFDEYGLELHPFRWGDEHDDALIAALAAWRAEFMAVYPTQFEVTLEGTRMWLAELILDLPDRLMWVVRRGDEPVGHLGFDDLYSPSGQIALSNVVIGVRDAMPQGAMAACERAILRWAFDELGATSVSAVIFQTTIHAIKMHRKLGYTLREKIPLRRHQLAPHQVEFRPCEPGDSAPPDQVWERYVLDPEAL